MCARGGGGGGHVFEDKIVSFLKPCPEVFKRVL